MNELLDSAVAAHGGLDRWNQVRSITVGASITGAFWHLKGKGDALKNVRFEVDTTRERLTMDFPGQDKRSVFQPGRVVIQRHDGTLIDARDDPERSFDGHQFETPWDDIQLAYFTGEALWTYPDGLLRRHDFTIDIVPAPAESQLYATGYREVDGLIIPATRRAYGPDGDQQLVMVAIDMGEITVR
jgi:hypothetical protein